MVLMLPNCQRPQRRHSESSTFHYVTTSTARRAVTSHSPNAVQLVPRRVCEKEADVFPKLSSEFLGTFWLVLGGCGSAVLAAGFPALGIGFAGVSLAFGLTVLSGAYALGPVSGGHFNPAVTIGLWAGGRFPARDVPAYVIAQVIGAIAGAAVLYVIASGQPAFELGGFASNGFGEHSPGGYSLTSALVTEVVMTFMFLLVILGATH